MRPLLNLLAIPTRGLHAQGSFRQCYGGIGWPIDLLIVVCEQATWPMCRGADPISAAADGCGADFRIVIGPEAMAAAVEAVRATKRTCEKAFFV